MHAHAHPVIDQGTGFSDHRCSTPFQRGHARRKRRSRSSGWLSRRLTGLRLWMLRTTCRSGSGARHVLTTLGPPNILINNAAPTNTPAPLWEIPVAEFASLVDVNIKGTTNVVRHFVPAITAQGRGVTINFRSGWGRSAAPNVVPYCASKWAIEGLTRSLAQELPKGMVTVSLNPGIIDTDMLRISFEESAGSYESPTTWLSGRCSFC